ncbi:FlgD immunoglobulin-like domain containing protein [Singulisphaera sp. PoT]|uniref:FlgD immunoglobulin-like domain containing protein n=1 Tax=Singulisphaera sp. PoT TaxID=3411797 RepID=UPI003BF60DB5
MTTAITNASALAAGPVASVASTLSSTASAATGDFASLNSNTGIINFTLADQATTTVGIFNDQGQLVRTILSMSPLSSGAHSVMWDGKDDSGVAVAPGNYKVEIALNRNTYENVGAIGQSVSDPSFASHMPSYLESVAVDSSGGIYTANGWDEPGADFKKWDAAGNSIYDANYAIRNGTPNGAPYRITLDDTYMYFSVGAWGGQQQIWRFNISDGSAAPFTGANAIDGHIQVYATTDGLTPANASTADASIYKAPLQSLAVSGNTLYVADAAGNRVLQYNKTTGELIGQFSVSFPQAMGIDSKGNLWIAHDHGTLSVFSTNGTPLGDSMKGIGDIASIAFGPNGNLYLANSTAGQVQIYSLNGINTKLVQTLGQPAQPGDSDPSHFFDLQGAAVDSQGNIVTIQNHPVGGAEMARFAPDGTVLWRQFSNEFVSLGNYGQDNPDQFYSMTFHHYELNDPNSGTWSYEGNTAPSGTLYSSNPHGVPRVLSFGGHDFYFMPTGDGVEIYRIDGDAFHLASIVGGRDPAPDASIRNLPQQQWTWSDADGTGVPKTSEINWSTSSAGTYSTLGMNVDGQGNIWYADNSTRTVWEIPVGPLDANGNPTYSWADARQVISKDTTRGFLPQTVQKADDGSIYVIGWSSQSPETASSFWMGGSTLARYDANGNMLWSVILPEDCTGIDVIPGGGGVILGGGVSAFLYQYTDEGLLIGLTKPGAALNYTNSWYDNQASVAVNRNPNDGMLDVFTEDDLGLHIGWYRINDHLATALSLAMTPPFSAPTSPTDLAATPQGPGQVTLSWTPILGATYYNVERSTDGTNWTQVTTATAPPQGAVAAISLTDVGLSSGTTYYYRVQGANSTSALPYSAVVDATTQSTAVKQALANYNFTANSANTTPNYSFMSGSWTTANGILSQTATTTADPTKALLSVPNATDNLMVTARVRVDSWPANSADPARAGVGLQTDPNTGYGYNLLFHGPNTVAFLDDQVAWGNSYTFNWTVGQWYWFQMMQYEGTIYAKVWQDGTAEPTQWMYIQEGWNDRTGGLPSLNGGSGMSTDSFTNVRVDASSLGTTTDPGTTVGTGDPTTTPVDTSNPTTTPVDTGVPTNPTSGTTGSSNPPAQTVDTPVTNPTPVDPTGPTTVVLAGGPTGSDSTTTDSSQTTDSTGTGTQTDTVVTDPNPPASNPYGSDLPTPVATASFSGSTVNPNWTLLSGAWTQSGGVLSQTAVSTADPTKAVLSVPTSSQNLIITAQVRVDSWPANSADPARAGVGLSTDVNGLGYNLLFHGPNTVQFLDDQVAWGNSYSFNWTVGQWYWFQLMQYNGTLYGKIWADGTSEPTQWMFVQEGWGERNSGLPSLNGGSGQSTDSFANVRVDYADSSSVSGNPIQFDTTHAAADATNDATATAFSVESLATINSQTDNSTDTVADPVPAVTAANVVTPAGGPTKLVAQSTEVTAAATPVTATVSVSTPKPPDVLIKAMTSKVNNSNTTTATSSASSKTTAAKSTQPTITVITPSTTADSGEISTASDKTTSTKGGSVISGLLSKIQTSSKTIADVAASLLSSQPTITPASSATQISTPHLTTTSSQSSSKLKVVINLKK